MAVAGSFEEAHSHATGHLLLPEDPKLLHRDGSVVLVDDELSTGATALNTIAELHRIHPHDHYVIAALVDVRGEEDRERTAKAAATLGVPIDVVALEQGTVSWPSDFAARAAAVDGISRRCVGFACRGGRHRRAVAGARTRGRSARIRSARRRRSACGGRRARGTRRSRSARAYSSSAPRNSCTRRCWSPLALADRLPDVRFSTTTRSPVVVVDDPGYPIRSAALFDADGPRFAYNVDQDFTDIVLVADDGYAAGRSRARAPESVPPTARRGVADASAASAAVARTGVRVVRPARGGLAADRSVRRRPRGPDGGA